MLKRNEFPPRRSFVSQVFQHLSWEEDLPELALQPSAKTPIVLSAFLVALLKPLQVLISRSQDSG